MARMNKHKRDAHKLRTSSVTAIVRANLSNPQFPQRASLEASNRVWQGINGTRAHQPMAGVLTARFDRGLTHEQLMSNLEYVPKLPKGKRVTDKAMLKRILIREGKINLS